MKRLISFLLITTTLAVAAGSGCGVYFNTFFNAKKNFNEAEKARKKIAAGGQNEYKVAIDKALKVVDNHPNSKYYDDALYILGVSYFHTKQWAKSERRLRELVANYEEFDKLPEAEVYLAQAKLELGDVEEAVELFEKIFASKVDKRFKATSALALAEHYQETRNFGEAQRFLEAVRDSLGNDEQIRRAQVAIAESYMDNFRFEDALRANMKILELSPTKEEQYRALFNASEAAFRMSRVEEGMGYLERLTSNELYFDSLGALRLKIAEGHEINDDLQLATAVYRDLVNNSENKLVVAEANYRLGLIAQYDHDDLKAAKEYYDLATKASPSSTAGKEALKHSGDIGKLEEYSKAVQLDTSATAEAIERAARTQYQLAELYWFQLNKPDSAIAEMKYLIDSFPTSKYVPGALIALSQMYLEYYSDSATADSILEIVVSEHARSNEAGQALELLGRADTPSDTGYVDYYASRADYFVVDSFSLDSARYYFSKIIELFPETDAATRAEFALIWLRDRYEHPGDSSIVYAYQEFADSNPNNPWSTEARRLLTGGSRRTTRIERDTSGDTAIAVDTSLLVPDTAGNGQNGLLVDTTTSDYGQFQRAYITPDGDTTVLLTSEPTRIEKEFEFPPDAYSIEEREVRLYFQVLLDFSGKVMEYILKVPSTSQELNEKASETVASMTFDPVKMSQQVFSVGLPKARDDRGWWFVYVYKIERPGFVR